MARPLSPCGTPAAYRRHRRRGEPVDDKCAAAARDQKNARAQAKRDEIAEAITKAVDAAPPVPDDIDELEEARETLRLVTAAMKAGAPGLAALAKQRMELVALVKRLESASKPKESRLDELARRRAERLAASAG